jgi:hypothetical protein
MRHISIVSGPVRIDSKVPSSSIMCMVLRSSRITAMTRSRRFPPVSPCEPVNLFPSCRSTTNVQEPSRKTGPVSVALGQWSVLPMVTD